MTVAFDQARGTDGTLQPAFDEMKAPDGALRPAYGELWRWLNEVPPDVLDYRRREAELLFRRIGITFAVYGEADAQERLIPFDVLPRILAAAEWDILRAGLEQRIKAINHYIRDVYHRRDILRAGVVPEDLVFQNPVFRPEPRNEWESNFTTSHTLLRLEDGSFRLWYAGRKQPPWSNLYFAIGTARWKGPGK